MQRRRDKVVLATRVHFQMGEGRNRCASVVIIGRACSVPGPPVAMYRAGVAELGADDPALVGTADSRLGAGLFLGGLVADPPLELIDVLGRALDLETKIAGAAECRTQY